LIECRVPITVTQLSATSIGKWEVVIVQTGEACYCKRDIISVCTAGGPKQQENCRFYQPSTFKNACMHYVFDAYCDNVEAQRNTQCAV
jgi:hypothetical protein